MTPEEFAAKMREISGIAEDDEERGHRLADALLCEVLAAMGYGEGVTVFDEMDKWYA